jgi:hypothetical protein
MKKSSLLSLLLLAVLASGASAAQSQSRSEPVVLPTYVVESERYAAAEQHVVDSLNELRAQAATPVVVLLELPALKARVAQGSKQLSAMRLAKS